MRLNFRDIYSLLSVYFHCTVFLLINLYHCYVLHWNYLGMLCYFCFCSFFSVWSTIYTETMKATLSTCWYLLSWGRKLKLIVKQRLNTHGCIIPKDSLRTRLPTLAQHSSPSRETKRVNQQSGVICQFPSMPNTQIHCQFLQPRCRLS